MPPIISIVGKSKSGKTTLLEKLIPELKKRGYRIGTIKHASNSFELDKKGKDSWRHREAGANTVLIVTKDSFALIKDNDCNSIECFAKYYEDIEIILAEGFSKENIPKIEVFRKIKQSEPLCLYDPKIIALVTDSDINTNILKFGLDEVKNLADFIEKKYLCSKKTC